MINTTENPRRPPPKKGATPRRSKRDRYTPVACNECKLRKVKCSGHSTCRRCFKHAIQCVYDRMLPAELDALNPGRNGDSIQSKLSQMQASLDSLLQSVKPDVSGSPISVDSRRGSDVGSNATVENLAALVGIEDTMHCVSGMRSATRSLTSHVVPSTSRDATSRLEIDPHPLSPLARNEALGVIDGFQEEIDNLYPFINLVELKDLLDRLFCSIQPQNRPFVQTSGWSDMDDSRNLDFLKLIIACGLVARGKVADGLSHQLMATVEEENLKRMNGLDVDMKDLAIATMLSVYYYQNDEITLAWRKIGAAARICLESGLHKLSRPPTDEIATRQAPWVSKMFWCIYVLDRRYSFMSNLPFVFQDEDIDPELPLPDNSSPFLLPMVSYGRLGAKIMPVLPKLKSASDDLDENTCMYLGTEIDHWVQSTATATCSSIDSMYHSSDICSQVSNDNVATFCRVRGNQMRLSLYKHALHSPARIARNQHFAHLAVHSATDNIRLLRQLSGHTTISSSPRPSCEVSKTQATTAALTRPQVQNNFFLVSSLAVLYLAMRNAPHRYYSGPYVHDYFAALNLLRVAAAAPAASTRLRDTLCTLERATSSLAAGPGPGFGNGLALGLDHAEVLPEPELEAEQSWGSDGLSERVSSVSDGYGGAAGVASWVDGSSASLGGGCSFWDFGGDVGCLSPPDSYFLESDPLPNGLSCGDYWPQG